MFARDIPPQPLLDAAAAAVAQARAAGADAAEAVARSARSIGVNVRLGAIEDVEQSETTDLALRLFIGQRSASLSTGDLSAPAIAAMVERGVAMARLAPENPWSGLAPAELLAAPPYPDLDLCDDATGLSAPELRNAALAVEDAARSVAGVTNSDGGSSSQGASVKAHVTSTGFTRVSRGTHFSISASVIAGTGADMQRDHDYHMARYWSDIEPAEVVGASAGRRAVARMHPGRVAGGAMPVLFDPRVAGSIVGHVVNAMSGPAIARKRSFLNGREGDHLFPDAITLRNDPHRRRGMRSRVVDGEGLPTRPSLLVDRGRIGAWLCDLASARQLGREPTGHGSGTGSIVTGNLSLDPGPCDRDCLMADIKEGVLVTELIGQGVDLLTGDYSRGASGWRIVDGRIAGPVAGFTVAGNLLDMFADLRAADDLCTRHATHVPTLRTDSMTIAGD